MRVVLFQSVANLGLAGEIVDVKPGYFRNYLEPRGYALRETPGALRLLASKKIKIEQALLKERSQAEQAQKAISEITLTFRLKAGEKGRLFGSVTTRDIADALHDKGIEVDRHKIEMPDSIKSIGGHKAKVRLHPQVVADLNVVVEPENPEAIQAQAQPVEKADESAAPSKEPEDKPAKSESADAAAESAPPAE